MSTDYKDWDVFDYGKTCCYSTVLYTALLLLLNCCHWLAFCIFSEVSIFNVLINLTKACLGCCVERQKRVTVSHFQGYVVVKDAD